MSAHSAYPFSAPLAEWFQRHFGSPSPVQAAAWPRILAGQHCLISAGTGQGKTLAALLPLLDRLLASGQAEPEFVLYIAPLRALAVNLQAGLMALLEPVAWPRGPLRIAVRSGDTPAAERRSQLRWPPHVLLTTPESLFVLLGSAGGRKLLARARAVVIDELHVYLDSKRGAHLALSLERLAALRGDGGLQRLGLSATIRPARLGARFLVGPQRDCALVRCPAEHSIDVAVELGLAALLPQADAARWGFVLERLAEIASQAERSLVFCNTRAQVERVARRLAERLGPERVAAHHGSLGKAQRAQVETALRSGAVSVVVCSATLELGIDIGPLDRVCQIGAVNGINLIRQRAGRSGHGPGRRPRIHLFPLNQAEGLDMLALQDALARRSVERGRMPQPYLDVLAQQLVAMLGQGLDEEEQILSLIRRSGPWADFPAAGLAALIQMLHDGYIGGREVGRGPLLRLSGGRLQAADHAGLLSRLNAGTLPEWFDYSLVDADSGRELGRLDEEFAFESSVGQLIHLGGESFRIVAKGMQQLRVRAEDEGDGELPFWLGEGSGRSGLLSAWVRRRMSLAERGQPSEHPELDGFLALARDQLGALPHAGCVVIERFFDPGGDEHLVLHSVHGQRINRAWGLALRKRFCRRFNFELQAAVTDNAILISLGATHSFPLAEVIAYLRSASLREVLIQAVLDTPQFALRLRWCANIALAVPRREPGGVVLPQIQRNQTENLIARVFPDQLACLENLEGPRRVPEHPLVQQALADCLDEFMDARGLERIYRAIEAGRIAVHCRDTDSPSLLAQAAILAPRHAYLDPAAAEERRVRTFEASRPARAPALRLAESRPMSTLARPEALEQALLKCLYLPAGQAHLHQAQWAFGALRKSGAAIALWADPGHCLWVHTDCLHVWLSLLPEARLEPCLPRGLRPLAYLDAEEALCRIALGAVRRLGSASGQGIAGETGLALASIQRALQQLEFEGLLSTRSAPGLYAERGPGGPRTLWTSRLAV